MDNEIIDGGCILLSRQILNSDIWKKPPEYLKIFLYILLRVNHKNELYPRGSNFFNFSDQKPDGVTLNQIYKFLSWARSEKVQILATRKSTRGVVIKVNNYDRYQTLDNYYRQDTRQNDGRTAAGQRQDYKQELSKVLTDYVVKNSSTDEEQDKLRQHLAYTIISYLAYDYITKRNAKRDVAEKIISEISFKNYVGVKSTKGDQVAASIIPKALVKNKSNEEIIEMAKSCPNFDLIEGGEISIMTDDELKDYLQKAKNAVVNEQDKEEKEECQTQTV